MRNKSIIFCVIAIAAAALFTNCSKESETLFEAAPEKVYVQVDLGTTKTYMGASSAGVHKMYWSNGDKIAINGTASEELTGLADDTPIATFAFTNAPVAPYNVVYPASIYTDASHVTLPATQTWKSGNFADGMNPMAGYNATGTGNITLHHLCAILKISVKRGTSAPVDEDNLVAVRFKGRNSEQVCGSFTIDYENAALAGASSAAADKEVRVNKNIATSTSEAAVFYIVVPAQTYSSGFDVTVQDQNGHIMTKSVTVSKELEAGHLYNMPEFEFVPTATELGVVITSAQDLIDFATAYNNKEYDSLGDALVATLSNDIAFDATSSAAFNTTGGIGLKNGVNGTEDYYFNGLLNGANHEISGLTATVPLFCATGSSGIIKDLTIADDCTFTFTHPKTSDMFFGPIVGYHKGIIDNVIVHSDITLSAVSEIAYETCLGGIAGRETVGTISNSSYYGTITIPEGFDSAAKKIQIGGIVGRISNADGKVNDCNFLGIIDNQGKMITASETEDLKRNPYLLIGGIVGLNSGTVSSCTAFNHSTGVTVTLNDGSDHDYKGTIVTHSTNAYHYSIAGIAGRNDGTVAYCINKATVVSLFSAARGTSGNMNGRYLKVGGIVGFNSKDATISGCNNQGAIINRANPKMHNLGGIAGYNNGAVSSCTNESTGTIGVGTSHSTPYGARMLYLGGVIGLNDSNSSVSNISNAAALTVSRIENTTGIIVSIGGVIGASYTAVDGSSDGGTITNTGAIAQSSGIGMCDTPTDTNDYGLFLGGIVGYATNNVKNVSNGGTVTYTCNATGIGAQYVHVGGVVGKVKAESTVDIEKCTNTANVTFTASAKYSGNNATRYYHNYLGGIVGYAQNAAIKGDSSNHSTNSGIIKGGDGSANNNTNGETVVPSFIIGGIVGCITGESSIGYCELSGTGQAYNDHWSNRGISNYDCPMNGGIAGYVVGADGEPITISNCTVSSTSGTDGNTAVYSRRGAVGGIVGMAKYATVSNCSVPVAYSGSGYFYGGIIAAAQNTTVNSCTYSGSTIKSSQIQIGGGIIGKLDTGSTVDGCSSSATTIDKNGTAITPYGGIAGSSVAGTVIKNCHYKSTIQICGDSNFTDNGEANANDL